MTRHGPRHPHHPGLRLAPARRRVLFAVCGGAWATGILWLIFHYFLTRAGEFGPEPHPLEAWWLRLHGVSAFAALWIGGLLWAVHIRPGLVRARRRATGIALLVLGAVLACSGYLLYYASDDALRDATRLVHWMIGLALAPLLIVHIVRGRLRRD